MNRRNFFKTMSGGVANAYAVRTWPFRVFSFPSEIKIAKVIPDCDAIATINYLSPVRIPVRIRYGSATQFSPTGRNLGMGHVSYLEAVTIHTEQELETVIKKYGLTQPEGWSDAVREVFNKNFQAGTLQFR